MSDLFWNTVTDDMRKDFYDLYFICQGVPLKQIFEKADQKYPAVRDFEVQAIKRLVFFGNAENESEPSPIGKCVVANRKRIFH